MKKAVLYSSVFLIWTPVLLVVHLILGFTEAILKTVNAVLEMLLAVKEGRK